MTSSNRTSRARRLVVVATLAMAMLGSTAAYAAPSDTSPGQAKKASSDVNTQGLSWLGLSWL
jgi:hypothetical protein